MPTFPAATAISTAANQGAAKTLFEDFLGASKQLPGGVPATTLTLASDQITPTQADHRIDTESAVSTDDLKQILQSVLPDGSLLRISPVSAARVVRVWNAAGGTGQIILKTGDNFFLADPSHWLLVKRVATSWEEIDRFPSSSLVPHVAKNANYTVQAADRGKSIYSSSSTAWTLTLPDAATMGQGFDFYFNARGQGIVSVVPTGADTVGGKTSLKIHPLESVHFIAGSAEWLVLSRSVNMFRPTRGYMNGFAMSNDVGDPTNDIVIQGGYCASDDYDEDIVMLRLAFLTWTKQLDVAWAAGSGTKGGRISSESLVDGTWYVYAFRRQAGDIDVCFSQSLSPTLPDGGTHKRRIGALLRESGAIVGFIQDGDYFRRVTAIRDVNATNPGSGSGTTATLSVPTGINVDALINVFFQSSTDGTEDFLDVTDMNATDAAPGSTNAPLGVLSASSSSHGVGQFRIRTNTSRQIRYRPSVSDGNVIVRIATLGWYDRRGRD